MKIAKNDTVRQSYIDLYRIYQPSDIDKFTREFVSKYGIEKGHEDELKKLVE